jgi:hypothetical protein
MKIWTQSGDELSAMMKSIEAMAKEKKSNRRKSPMDWADAEDLITIHTSRGCDQQTV